MKHTKRGWVDKERLADVRLKLRLLLPSLKFRYHGLGMIQAYLPTGLTANQQRVHIFTPDLIDPEMEWSGTIHDHRFYMESLVVTGTLWHHEVDLLQHESEVYELYEVVGARFNKPEPPKKLPGHYGLMISEGFKMDAGTAYHFEKRQFHKSVVDNREKLAVTIITKHFEDPSKARIVGKSGHKAIHGFEKKYPVGHAIRAYEQAMEALR